MPMYAFRCEDCGLVFDRIQKFKDPYPTCPQMVEGGSNKEAVTTEDSKVEEVRCEGKTEKLISGGSFILKGGGWFKDGYS